MAKTRTPGREAHLYALMAWNDKYTKEEAEAFVDSTPYAELNNTTWAETSVKAAVKGIVEKIGIPAEVGPESDYSAYKMVGADEVYDAVIEILAEIHDKWVRENAKKYDRGNEAKSEKNLYQHTPTALIGLDEVAKDLMFLAPFLKEMGLNAGEMDLVPYGAFKPSEEIAAAYQRYVEKYMAANKIYTTPDLSEHIKSCIKGGYAPLAPVSEMAEKRAAYMMARTDLLTEAVKAKSPEVFGKLPATSQPQ